MRKMFHPNLLDGERIIGDVMNTHIKWIIIWTCIRDVHFQPTDLLPWHPLAACFDIELVNVYGRMKLYKYCFV